MERLHRQIHSEATYLGNGIINVSHFLNHGIDTQLMADIGKEFSDRFAELGIKSIDKVVTVETSGIAPALTTALALKVPMVFARKKRPVSLATNCYTSIVRSHTKGDTVTLHIANNLLSPQDRIVIIDDILGIGETTRGLLDLIQQSGARLCAIGYVLEKVYEHGRDSLANSDIPIISLARLDVQDNEIILLP